MAAITKNMSFDSTGKKKREGKVGADVAELNGLMSRHRITPKEGHAAFAKDKVEPAGTGWRDAGLERDGAIPEAGPSKIERDGRQQFSQAEERLYLRMHQIESMKHARPAKSFSGGDPIEYTFHMVMFEEVTNQSTITSQDKLREMMHWFDGNPKKIIMYHRIKPQNTPDIAFKDAKSELDKLFGPSIFTVCAMMNAIILGEQLEENDYNGHLDLYAELREIQTIADCANETSQVHCSDFVIRIFDSRLKHLVQRFCENQREKLEERGDFDDFYNFPDLMEEIQDWLSILRAMNPKTIL